MAVVDMIEYGPGEALKTGAGFVSRNIKRVFEKRVFAAEAFLMRLRTRHSGLADRTHSK